MTFLVSASAPKLLFYLHWCIIAEYICRFYIKDCCSAGGTYLRIAFGVPKPMYPGLMIMLGKHQLIVLPPKGEGSSSSSFDEGGFKEVNKENSEDVNVTASSSPETSIVEAATAEEPR